MIEKKVRRAMKPSGKLQKLISKRDMSFVDQIGKDNIGEYDKKTGETPLGVACRVGWYQAAFTLIEVGADVNQFCVKKGKTLSITPLYAALCAYDHKDGDIVKLLLYSGANPNLNSDKSPLYADELFRLIVAQGNTDDLALLIQHGLTVSFAQMNFAISADEYEIFKLVHSKLMREGYSLDQIDEQLDFTLADKAAEEFVRDYVADLRAKEIAKETRKPVKTKTGMKTRTDII